jgi:uncharacterized protein DUF5758/pentapeptide repeat protein
MRKKRAKKSAEPKTFDLPASPQLQSSSLKSRLNASAEHKRPFKIKDRYSGRVLFETEAETLKDAVEEAVTLQVSLTCADLRNADLGGAWLAQAELSNADLSGANLFKAILWRAALTGARFCNVDLRYANFRYANLKKAVLRNSELICTCFPGSNLTQADFRSSNLEGANLWGANITNTSFDPRPTAPKEGSFEAWKVIYDKKANPVIARILIPEDAQRTTPLGGRVCRAEFVKVLELSSDISFAKCRFYPDRVYYIGGIVNDVDYDDNVQIGCSEHGIQFYLTREEIIQDWFPPSVPVAEYWKSSETYRGWIGGIKYLNQPDNQESRWRAGTLFDAYKAKLMNQWDEEPNAGMNQAPT